MLCLVWKASSSEVTAMSLLPSYAWNMCCGTIQSILHQYSKKAMEVHSPREATTSGEVPDNKCLTVLPILKLWPKKVERFGDNINLLQRSRKVCLRGSKMDPSGAWDEKRG